MMKVGLKITEHITHIHILLFYIFVLSLVYAFKNYNSSLGIFPNNFKKKDPKFTAVFYNLLPYSIDLYGVEFEGRKHQITKELETGNRRKELTRLSIPWVFKQSGSENRLLAFIGSSNLSFFKGEALGLKEGSTIHVTINENGKLYKKFMIQLAENR